MCVDVKSRLEPIQRCIGRFNVLGEKRFGVSATVNGLGPQDIGRREVVGIEGDDEVGIVQWCIKTDHVKTRGVDRFVTEGDVHLGVCINGVVQSPVEGLLVGEVAEVDGQGRKHAVDHQARIEVITEESAVGDDQLSTVLNREWKNPFPL